MYLAILGGGGGEFIRCECMLRLYSHPREYRKAFLANNLFSGFVPGVMGRFPSRKSLGNLRNRGCRNPRGGGAAPAAPFEIPALHLLKLGRWSLPWLECASRTPECSVVVLHWEKRKSLGKQPVRQRPLKRFLRTPSQKPRTNVDTLWWGGGRVCKGTKLI